MTLAGVALLLPPSYVLFGTLVTAALLGLYRTKV